MRKHLHWLVLSVAYFLWPRDIAVIDCPDQGHPTAAAERP